MPARKRSKRANGEGTVYQLPNGRWRAEFTLRIDANGKQKRKRVTADTKQEAVEKRDKLKGEVAAGLHSEDASKIRTADYLRRWLKHKRPGLKPKSYAGYEQVIELYAVDKIGGKMLSKLGVQDIKAMMNELSQEKSLDVANRARKVVSTALEEAVEEGVLARNPAKKVKPYPRQKREMVVWSTEQAMKFLDTAKAHRLYAAFYLLVNSGLRCGELLGLEWDDLDGCMLHVRRSLVLVKGEATISTPKTTNGVRKIALSPDVVDVLAEHRKRQQAEHAYLGDSYQDEGIMFASVIGTRIHPRNLLRDFYNLQKQTVKEWIAEAERNGDEETARRGKADKLLPRITLHDLRHLHASIAIRSGMDPKRLAQRLGHANASLTLDVYTHLFESRQQRDAVSIMDSAGTAGSRALN